MKLMMKLSQPGNLPSGLAPSHAFDQYGGSVGRGEENDWVLPDPSRKLSRKHFTIDFEGGAFFLTDLSANGIFLNFAGERLQEGRRVRLNNGDHLRLGDYEMDAWIEDAGGAAVGPGDTFSAVLAGRPPTPLPAEDDSLFGPPPPAPAPAAPASFPDHVAAENEFFRPPAVTPGTLPDDFGADLSDLIGPPPAAPAAPPAPPPAPVAAPSARAFFEGAGLAGAEGGEQTLRAAGLLFRAAIAGLRDLLLARSAVKHELHLDRTMMQPAGNNPLKVYATVEEVMAALLPPARPGYLPGPAALSEAVADLQSHEMAMLSGFQDMMRTLLAKLDPRHFVQAPAAGPLAPLGKARSWDAYCARYAALAESLQEDAASLMGKDFAEAYRRQVDKMERS